MGKASDNYILRLIVKRVLALLLFLLGAMGAFGRRELIFFSVYFGAALLSGLALYLVSPGKLHTQEKSGGSSWDNLLPCAMILIKDFLVFLAAGLGNLRLEPDVWFYLGLVLYAASEALYLWARAVNDSFAAGDRECPAELCRRGPYRYVRHPSYSAVLIWCFSICLIFPHVYVALAALTVMALTFALTYFEDKTLCGGLQGYAEYAEEVDFKLIPYLW